MEQNSIWKKLILLTFGGLMALHIQMVNASDKSKDVKVTSQVESAECVIMEDAQ